MLNEAGIALLGCHSVRDDEIKFGYAVTGVVETKKHLTEQRREPATAFF
jgi:selenophosphate synthase